MATKKIRMNELKRVIKEIMNEMSDYTDDENINIFLRKIKSENPNMFTRFYNIVKNKGLDVAKEKYDEFDPQKITQRKEQEQEKLNNEKLLQSFVKHLPKKLPEIIKNNLNKGTLGGYDSVFYLIIGSLIEKYGDRYGMEKANKLEDLVNDDNFEDFFFKLIDDRYGKGTIEW